MFCETVTSVIHIVHFQKKKKNMEKKNIKEIITKTFPNKPRILKFKSKASELMKNLKTKAKMYVHHI